MWVGWGRGSSDVGCPALLEVGVVTLLCEHGVGSFTWFHVSYEKCFRTASVLWPGQLLQQDSWSFGRPD